MSATGTSTGACAECGAIDSRLDSTADVVAWQGALLGVVAAVAIGVTVALAAVAILGSFGTSAQAAANLARPLTALPGVNDPIAAATAAVPLPLAVVTALTAVVSRRRGVWIGLTVVFVLAAVGLAAVPGGVATPS